MFASCFVVILGLCYCVKDSSESLLGLPMLSGPAEALVTEVAEFKCVLLTYPKNEYILLQLFKEGDRDKVLGEYTSLDGQDADFPIVVKLDHEGNLECVAKAQNNSNIEPTVSKAHHLKVVVPVKDAKIEVRSGAVEVFEGSRLELNCTLSAGNHVFYQWQLNGQLVSQPHHDSRFLIYRTTSKDSGSYMCIATNYFNNTDRFTSNSSETEIMIKDVVSIPDISVSVLKEHSHNYSAVVTCQSSKGTPPVTFSLYNRTELIENITTEERNAIFKIPLVLGQHLGFFQCQANNGDLLKYSKWIPIEVVPVGGPVTMHYDYDTGENYAVIGLRLYCKAAKGSLPQYKWFLNNTLLHNQGSFYHVANQPPVQSILLLSVGRRSAGIYHCEVSDSFDNSTAISSKRQYLDKEVLNRVHVWAMAVVFGSFTFLVLLVTACCIIGVVFRRRQYKEKSLLGLEMKRTVSASNDELDSSEYNEDIDVLEAASGGDFDQASVASVDEWPQIEEEKKTLEDEPVVGSEG